MDREGYHKVREAFQLGHVLAPILPVPHTGEDVEFVHVPLRNLGQDGHVRVLKALSAAGLLYRPDAITPGELALHPLYVEGKNLWMHDFGARAARPAQPES